MTIERARLQTWSDTLRAIAEQGAAWAGDDPYQRSRFERTKRVAGELAAATAGVRGQPWGDMLQAIANEGTYWAGDDAEGCELFAGIRQIAADVLSAQGFGDAERVARLIDAPRPFVGATPCGDAAVIDEHNRILLIQRRDSGLWAMPGGGFEVGETPSEGACREAWEETGLEVEPLALVGVYDSRLAGSRSRMHLYQFVFLCRPCDAAAQPVISNETTDVGWFAEDALPPLHPGHAGRIADVFRFRRGELKQTVWH